MNRNVFTIGGAFLIGLGLFWIGQGTGVVNWPASSFMIAQIQWAYIGGVVALLGAVLLWFARR